MTMLDSPERDGGVVRGVALICAIGIALGVAYNALGLASRPKYGLAWIKAPTRIESLEALQSAPAPTESPAAPAGTAHAAPAEGSASEAAPAPGGASPATSAAAAPARKPATKPAAEAGGPSPGAAKAGVTAASPAVPPAAHTPAPAPASKSAATAPRAAWTPPGGSASPAGGAAAGAAAATATAGAADLPVIPDVTGPLKVEIATLKRLHDANAALVLDAREAPEYAEGHIRGALSLSYNDALAEPERVKNLDPGGRPIVIYCSGGDCELSINLAKVLVEAGKRRVLIYEAGYPEWQAAGYPVAHGPNP